MSLYGRFDYLDILSRSDSYHREEEGATTPDVASEEEDYLVLEEVAATTVAESEDNTTLPSEIHLSSSDEETSYGTATILPSLPSDEVARMQLEQQHLQALSMQVQGAGPRTTRNAHSTISLSTTESHFTDIVPEYGGLSTVSSLSLSSVSSLPSSFSEEIVFEEEEEEESTTSSSSSSRDDEESTLVKDVPEPLACPRSSLFSRLSGITTTTNSSNKGPWYANLKTEQDWEAFRQECLVLMEAMGEDAPKNADEMIAQLIAEEEEVWYKKNAAAASKTLFGLSYETLTMLAGAALVPLVGYALASRNRKERVN